MMPRIGLPAKSSSHVSIKMCVDVWMCGWLMYDSETFPTCLCHVSVANMGLMHILHLQVTKYQLSPTERSAARQDWLKLLQPFRICWVLSFQSKCNDACLVKPVCLRNAIHKFEKTKHISIEKYHQQFKPTKGPSQHAPSILFLLEGLMRGCKGASASQWGKLRPCFSQKLSTPQTSPIVVGLLSCLKLWKWQEGFLCTSLDKRDKTSKCITFQVSDCRMSH